MQILNSYRVRFVQLLIGAMMFLMPAVVAQGSPVGLVFEAPTLQAAPGSSGSFDVLITNTSAVSLHLAAETVELGISGTGVEFTNTDANTLDAYVFPDSFDLDNGFTLDATGVAYPKNDFITSDVSNVPSSFVVVSLGQTLGVVHVSYTVDAGATLGPRTLTIEDLGGGTSTSDENGDAVPFTGSNGSLTVVAVPEPGCLGIIVAGTILLGRRRKY